MHTVYEKLHRYFTCFYTLLISYSVPVAFTSRTALQDQ